MHAADAAGDYLRLVEHYRQMKDPELLVLLKQKGELTDLARQVLETEVNHRRLQLEPEPEEATPAPEPSDWLDPSDPSSPTEPLYKEERELVDLCTVWSPRDALQVQGLLDVASIPFFMGPEKATGVADVTSNFVTGVTVKIMRIGWPWAIRAMKNYFPKDEPPEEASPEQEDVPVRCPKCQSTEVVFNRLVTEPPPNDESEFPPATMDSPSSSTQSPETPPKFDWACEACGYKWQDDGVAKE